MTLGLLGPEGISTKKLVLSNAYIGIQCHFATELVKASGFG